MPRRDLNGLRAIVTGASSGIGRELVRQLSDQGMQLLVTGRREDRLKSLCDEVAKRNLAYAIGDITDPHLQRSLVAKCIDRYGGIDCLINNAGIGAIGPFATSLPARLRRIFEVNFFAPVELTRTALPELVKGRTPLIVNVGSVLGHRAVPNKSEYCSSKFALHGFSDALRAELWRQGVHVMLVSPSTTASEFFDRLKTSNSEENSAKANVRLGMSPERVARKIVKAMRRNRDELIISAGGTSLVWLDRLCPPLANWLARRFP